MHGESPQYSVLLASMPLIKSALHYLHWELTERPGLISNDLADQALITNCKERN